MPIVGQIANKVPANPKCNGCLHYNPGKSICVIGLAPSSCGDGSVPDIGYAPLSVLGMDVDQAERPSHAEPARAGGVPDPQGPITVITSHLGDDSELLALAKSYSAELQKMCEHGCFVHQGTDQGQLVPETVGTVCTCQSFDKRRLAQTLHLSLSRQDQRKVSEEEIFNWVEFRIKDLVTNSMLY